ncbi:MAG: hypothetical protein IJF67_04280, partial [Clostridia bacterium]|nr:hypothetical protein [Clostridia bacterium]
MNKYINNHEFGTFPPHIENPAMNIIRTSHAGGSDIVYENGYLYLIATQKGGSLRILRTGEGEPVLLGELCGLGNMRQIEVSADAVPGRILAAMTARECGMYLVDVTNPEKPYVCCHYNSVEFATGVTFGDHYLAIGCRSFGVELVDIAVPEKPRHICYIRAGE